MEIIWADRVRREEVLHKVKEARDFLRNVKRRTANWLRHVLPRNCLLKRIIGGQI
jgi:hypothetical protein